MIEFVKEHLQKALTTVEEGCRVFQQEVDANVQRLQMSMQREKSLFDENANLKARVEELEKQLGGMRDHPIVKARLIQEAEAKLAQAAAQVEALKGPKVEPE